jgi:hypothetical protein
MHTRHCIQLAERIHTVMQRELGQGLDRARMLDDARYSRDVLLVCDALHGTPAPLLAHHFRRAAELPDEVAAPRRAPLAQRVARTIFGSGVTMELSGAVN